MSYCIACRAALPKEALFVLENAPASAQNIPDASEVGEDKGITLNLRQCPECGLVQFDCTPVDYYRDVIRAGGYSTTMTELRRRQYRHFIETYGLEGKKFLEVGCGRGEFINVLKEFPVQVFGMEHKEDLISIARENGLCVWREFPETPDQKFLGDPKVEGSEGPYDAFLSFNFLEHQPHPDVMLTAIYNNLNEGGMGLVTVPALEYIVERGNYYELIRDHIAYYSFDALRTLLENNGFHVLEEEMINRDTISMIVRKMSPEERKTESGTGPADADENIVASLIKGHEIVLNDINGLLTQLETEKKTIALWGASHQGFTLASTTPLCERVSYIIDSAPFKQGRFAPASHLPIVAPDYFLEHPVDVILIVAPGYSDEIAGVIRTRFGTGVRILTLRSERIEELS